MAKSGNIKIRLESSAGTGYFYVTKKNNRTMTDKLVIKKYDPVAKKHVDFKENKIKSYYVTFKDYLMLPLDKYNSFIWSYVSR